LRQPREAATAGPSENRPSADAPSRISSGATRPAMAAAISGTGRMVNARAAHQRDAVTILVGPDSPPVVLLLIDPAGAMEGLWSQFGLHRDQGGGESHPSNYRRGGNATQCAYLITSAPVWNRWRACRRAAYAPRPVGIVNVNVEPTPSWLLTQILPPWSSTNFRHRVSPSPCPPAWSR
jgi:hypothetical protein